MLQGGGIQVFVMRLVCLFDRITDRLDHTNLSALPPTTAAAAAAYRLPPTNSPTMLVITTFNRTPLLFVISANCPNDFT